MGKHNFCLFSWWFQEKCVTSQRKKKLKIGDTNMMLGINAPKPQAKGEFAKAVRKAVRDSLAAKENWKEPEIKGPWKVKFVVR